MVFQAVPEDIPQSLGAREKVFLRKNLTEIRGIKEINKNI